MSLNLSGFESEILLRNRSLLQQNDLPESSAFIRLLFAGSIPINFIFLRIGIANNLRRKPKSPKSDKANSIYKQKTLRVLLNITLRLLARSSLRSELKTQSVFHHDKLSKIRTDFTRSSSLNKNNVSQSHRWSIISTKIYIWIILRNGGGGLPLEFILYTCHI